MRTRQSLVLDTARHVRRFLDDNAALIGPSIASCRCNFDDVVTRLTTLAVTQTTSEVTGEGATARQKPLRATLRTDHMKPIAEVGQAAVA